MPDSRKKHINIPLNGKLLTCEPATIGTNFRTLTNMRYTDTHIKGISGSTKINTTALETYLKPRSAFHFRKVQPVESHVLAQSYNTGLTASVVLDNATTIPNTGHFNELMTLDVAPATAWVAGDTITGVTSAKTCVIVTVLTTLTYIVKSRSGTFTLGEVLTNGTYTADQGAANPTFALSALYTDSTGAGKGNFSNAPDGQIIYANGVDTCIWGGNEMRAGALITSTAVVEDTGVATNPKDYTERIQNSKTDGENIFNIGGGSDTYTKLLIHADQADGTAGTDILDSSDSGHTITAVGDAQVDTAYKKFGTGSVLFDGTGDYLTIPDHDDWNFGTGDFSIDFNINIGYWYDHIHPICGQYADSDNYWFIKITAIPNPGYFFVDFKAKSAGVVVADYSSSHIIGSPTGWFHYEITRNGAAMYAFANGISRTFTAATAISTNSMPDVAAVLEVGTAENHSSNFTVGRIDEFRISKGIARHTADFTPPAEPYANTVSNYFLIGSLRPLKGVKLYIQTGNSIASVLTGKVWNGSTWQDLTLIDNTDTGASLAVTGTITFDSTVGIAKPKYVEGYFLYWYQFYLDAGEATIYQITVDAPFQPLIDMWDGQYRDISACYIRTTALKDVSLNVYRDDYQVDTPDTYANLSSLGAFSAPANCLEIGFEGKVCGIHFRLPPEYVNSTADTTMAVDYWNGTEYVSVGTISDGTMPAAISFARSGVVTWNNANLADETRTNKLQPSVVGGSSWSFVGLFTNIGGTEQESARYTSIPLYFYRIRWDKAMDASVRVNYIGGITAQKTISHYKFPIFAQGRVLLCGDMSNEKNKVTCSAKYMPQVYSGTDTADVYIGEESELNCGVELFSQYGGNLYSLVMLFKDTESWVMAGQDISQWANNTFPISTSIGCPAPQTLKTINLAVEPGQGINRSLAIWQGTNGVYMSDGRAPIPIHGDIAEYFDKNDSRCIKASMIGDSVSFIDHSNQEYHWLFASGTAATTLNTELVYDIKRNRWYLTDRGTGMDLQHGVEIVDTYGNQYAYGFIDTGYMERLEYGTDFDGNSIVHTFQTGDFAPLDLWMISQLDHLKLIMVGKTTTTNDVICTHYSDTYSTGSDYTLDATPATNYRIAKAFFDAKLQGEPYHSLKFTVTTNDEVCGFEPIALSVTFHALQED